MLTLTALLPVAFVSQAGATMIEDASDAGTSAIAYSVLETELLDVSTLESASGEDQSLADTTLSNSESQGEMQDLAEEPSDSDESTAADDTEATAAHNEQNAPAKVRKHVAPEETDPAVVESGTGVVLGPATVYESPDQEEPIFLYGGPVSAKRAATVVTADRSVDPSASQEQEPEDAEWDGFIEPSFNETPTTFTSWREYTNKDIDVDDEVVVVEDEITVEESQSENTRAAVQVVAVASLAQTGANPVLLGLSGLVVALGIIGVATRHYYGKTRED